MQAFRKLGLFLNQEPGDEEAIAFAGRLATLFPTESLLCIHVRGVEAEPPGTPPPTTEEIADYIKDKLPSELADRTRVEVHEDNGIAEILRSARDESLDLIVVGRRLPNDQLAVGTAFSRLARKAPCSVLVVPDQARVHVSRMAVPVDGSEHSRRALEVALQIARACNDPEPEVVVQTIYEIGYGYQYSGLTFAEAVKGREEVARKQLDKFLAGMDTSGVHLHKISTCSNHPHAAVCDLVASKNLDLVVVGSRGLSRAASTLLGSFAERLLAHAPVPLLVVKQKGETLRLLDALLWQS